MKAHSIHFLIYFSCSFHLQPPKKLKFAITTATTQTVSMQGKKVRFALTAIHTTGKESAYAVF